MTGTSERIRTHSEPDEAEKNLATITRKLAQPIGWSDLGQLEHFVQFYETDDFLPGLGQ